MKRLIMMACAVFLGGAAAADDAPVVKRVSVFSTTTDWEALTGLRLGQYRGKFLPDSGLIGRNGLVLYYLDAFPCYGLGDGVRVWLGPKDAHDGELRIACVYPPDEIQFTWRNAARDADDAQSTGILTCPVTARGRDLTIDLTRCTKGRDWDDFK